MAGQIGLEPTPAAYIERMVGVFREVRRVLRDDGTAWVNMGDGYTSGGRGEWRSGASDNKGHQVLDDAGFRPGTPPGLKPKDLIGMPWRLAFALQADGWWLRSDIIWCLSGGTWVYARTGGTISLMMVRDMARLNPANVELWNGSKWTRLLGMSRTPRVGEEIEIVLRSGERIACSGTHRFPTSRGLLGAADIRVGDSLVRCRLPDNPPAESVFDEDAAWFAGLYLAEGSRSERGLNIAGHARETERWERVQRISRRFGGSATCRVVGNGMRIIVYGRFLRAIVDEFVSGRTAIDKGFAPPVWRQTNAWVAAMVDGYLSGDGHWDAKNNRWRLGFCRNYNLERDLRTACARLGYRLVLNFGRVKYQDRIVPTFRGEIRMGEPAARNWKKNPDEVREVRRARCRNLYDLGVADEPHLFALASGILTHNSKPNPMPESVTDRPTKAHEYLFLLTKAERYFFDAEAVKETGRDWGLRDRSMAKHNGEGFRAAGQAPHNGLDDCNAASGRNIRTVWNIPTQPFHEAHFATYPEALVRPCVLAGTSEKGCCPACGKGWVRVVERTAYEPEVVAAGVRMVDESRGDKTRKLSGADYNRPVRIIGQHWSPACTCPAAEPVPATVLDPFSGSGTTGVVACGLGRNYVGIELNPEYAAMSERRIARALRPSTARTDHPDHAPLFGGEGA